MAAVRGLTLLRISSCLGRNCAGLISARGQANEAAARCPQGEQEEERVNRELAKRCVPAIATSTPNVGGIQTDADLARPHRCPVMKFSEAKRQVRNYATSMRSSFGEAHRERYAVDEVPQDYVIDVSVPRMVDAHDRMAYYGRYGNYPPRPATTPGEGFTTLPFPLPLTPIVRKQIKLMQKREAQFIAKKELEMSRKIAEIEADEELCQRLALEARDSVQRSLHNSYRTSKYGPRSIGQS